MASSKDGDWIETKDQDPGGTVRLVQLTDIGLGEFRDRSKRYMLHEAAETLNCTFLEANDVLIARMPDPIGRACVFPTLTNDSVTVVDIMIWRRGLHGALPRLIMHFLNSKTLREKIGSLASGTTRQRIAGKKLKVIELPVPPWDEQRRIVDKVDTLLSKVRTLTQELNSVGVLFSRLKEAVLARAFDGQMTRAWRLGSSSSSQDASDTVPASWRYLEVQDIGAIDLGRQRSPRHHHGPYMRPYVRAANIRWFGWDLSDVKEMSFDPSDFSRFKLQDGDVLINEGSGSATEVGKPAIWKSQIANCCFQNTLLRVRPKHCTSEYLYYFFLFCARTGIFASKTRGINIHHLGKNGLSTVVVPVPPIDEQNEIVRTLDRVFKVIEKLQCEYEAARRLLGSIEESILRQAIEGNLVPQLLDDDPAYVVLDEIRNTRSKSLDLRSVRASRTSEGDVKHKKTRGSATMADKRRPEVSEYHLSEVLQSMGGSANAGELWQQSEMNIDEFYKLLRYEVKFGRVQECEKKGWLETSNASRSI